MDIKIQIYNFVKDYIVEHGYAPSYKDIAVALDISRSTAFKYVDKLEQEGLIELDRNIARSIKIVDWTE